MIVIYDDEYITKRNRQHIRMCKRYNTIIRHFKHCFADVKVKLYNSYCCSTHCCALIPTVLDKLSVTCRDFRASALFVILNVFSFVILRSKLVYSFFNLILYVHFLILCILANVS